MRGGAVAYGRPGCGQADGTTRPGFPGLMKPTGRWGVFFVFPSFFFSGGTPLCWVLRDAKVFLVGAKPLCGLCVKGKPKGTQKHVLTFLSGKPLVGFKGRQKEKNNNLCLSSRENHLLVDFKGRQKEHNSS